MQSSRRTEIGGPEGCETEVDLSYSGPEYRWITSLVEGIQILYFPMTSVYFREGNGTPFQYSCLENLMDGGAC